jgi:hypothetical protein
MNKLNNVIDELNIIMDGDDWTIDLDNLTAIKNALEILKCVKELLSENNISAMTASYLKLEEVVK